MPASTKALLECTNCRKKFLRFNCHIFPSKNIFCSTNCKNSFSVLNLKCLQCQCYYTTTKFKKRKSEARGSKKTFCSRLCMAKFKESLRILSICPTCRQKFSQTKWQKKNYRFCSVACKEKDDCRGENSRNYKNGIAIFRIISRENYGEICFSCRSTEKIEVHHIDKNRGNNTKENLRPLCRACHHAVHKNRLCLLL